MCHVCWHLNHSQPVPIAADEGPAKDVGPMLNKCSTKVLCSLGGAVVKAACLKSQKSRVRSPPWHSGFKGTNVSFPLARKDAIL